MPRPILKPSSSPGPVNLPSSNRPHVSFPPSPALVSATHVVLSRVEYDRSPLVVPPNDLALPERGCPGRTYTLTSPIMNHPASGKHIHPAALNSANRDLFDTLLPPLIPDGSSSDESDGLVSPPNEPVALSRTSPPFALFPSKPDPSIPYARAQQQHGQIIPPALHISQRLNDEDATLAFLPRSPRRKSPPRKSFISPTASSFTEGVLGGF